MLDIFKKFFLKKKFKKKKYLVAVSGGVDSMVILVIFFKIFKHNLGVLNCHFNLNNNYDSNILILKYCLKRNINFYFKNFNLKKKRKKKSKQMVAREVRYKWFYKILKKYKYDYLILGHNLNDNIETFFINLLRGSGVFGLKGIKFKNKKIIRPYLIFNINKKKILNYAIKKKIKWVDDKSNFKNIYLRNKIRNLILPFLKKNLNNFEKNLYNSLRNLKLEYLFLKNIIYKIKKKIFFKRKILNFKLYFLNIKKILNFKYYNYILYKIFFKYGFKNKKNLNNSIFLKSGKFIFSNKKKFILIKHKKYLIFTKNKNYKIKKKIKNLGFFFILKNIFFKLKEIKKKKKKKKKIYIY
ncbi:MAG: tRNA lysidine(34) synthetase TilS [Candidatus Shikimatogenerans bostrichidophilus]|nr:MAG: tRNA lysidine(34) synthetase TilS [Candidatus Shikimatogenerans bostrichidophilus]